MCDEPTVPYGYCHCGCGERTTIAKQSDPRKGSLAGHPYRFLHGHHSRARNVPLCGYVIEDRGYLTPCWVWGLDTRNGYGCIRRAGQSMGAHVAMWTDRHGPVPPGLQLDHLCRVRACCNPDHLEPVTAAVNTRRGLSAKLDEARVIEIRGLVASGWEKAAIASAYGIHVRHVGRLASGERWALPRR